MVYAKLTEVICVVFLSGNFSNLQRRQYERVWHVKYADFKILSQNIFQGFHRKIEWKCLDHVQHLTTAKHTRHVSFCLVALSFTGRDGGGCKRSYSRCVERRQNRFAGDQLKRENHQFDASMYLYRYLFTIALVQWHSVWRTQVLVTSKKHMKRHAKGPTFAATKSLCRSHHLEFICVCSICFKRQCWFQGLGDSLGHGLYHNLRHEAFGNHQKGSFVLCGGVRAAKLWVVFIRGTFWFILLIGNFDDAELKL